jgi:hypothetical protein
LEQKFGVPIENVPEYIIQGKQRIDRLEDEIQQTLMQKQQGETNLKSHGKSSIE